VHFICVVLSYLYIPVCMEDDATSRMSFLPNRNRMDLNQSPIELNIWFTLRDIKFTIYTKISCRLRLIDMFGEDRYQRILQYLKPLLLGEVGPNHVSIFMMV
jgi:hypothetical protein